ncbi:MAG: hypothetical protein LUH54_05155, partial [Firmicutes bacterium]|nr:hypothetical protein [Bacillota bacterium]
MGLSDKKNKKKRVSLAGSGEVTPVMLPDLDEDEGKNKYYLNVSRIFGYLRFITIGVLVAFVLFMVTVFGDEVTVSN